MRKHIQYLEQHKDLVGLEGWRIIIAMHYMPIDSMAEVDPCLMSKTLKIKLSKAFEKESLKARKAILLHELIHARLEIFRQEKEKFAEHIEEELANDLERGLCIALGLGRNIYK